MDLRITLAPDGGLRLILPTGRSLDVGTTDAALRFIQRILRNAGTGEKRNHIGDFPTQAVIEIWRREDLAVKREAQRGRFEDLGIDIAALDISL